MAIRITEDRARALLRQCKWLLLACVVALAVFGALLYGVKGNFDKLPSMAWGLFLTYWLAGVLYFIWLGRLAYGLGRSVVYYVGGTWLLSSMIFLLAHIVAYTNIKHAVKKAFGAKLTQATA
jgi:hypothetical protein